MKNLYLFFIFFTSVVSAQDFEITTIDNTISSFESDIIDLDNDGLLDILTATINGELIWYKNESNNAFDKTVISSVPGNTLVSLSVTDADNDDDLDIFVANFGLNIIQLYENDGDENFTPHQIAGAMTIDPNDVFFEITEIEAMHLNDDNIIDFIVSQNDPNHPLRIFIGTTSGYTYQNIESTSGASLNQLNQVADFNNDGDIDILFSLANNSINWLDNDGSGNFSTMATMTPMDEVSDAVLEDFDGDGDRDLIASITIYGIELFLNNGDNTFTAGTLIVEGNITEPFGIFSLSALDYDGDNNMDFVFSSSLWGALGNENMRIYTNNGNAQFTLAQYAIFDTENIVIDTSIADIDGLGAIDYIISAPDVPILPPTASTGLLYIRGESALSILDVTQTATVVFPNPFKNKLSILSETPLSHIDIYSIDGKLVYTNKDLSATSQIDLSFLSRGIYLARIDNAKTYKLIKE